ncbi:MAG: NUDIX domain-containing protein [Verrucomicrobiota bacterium]|nr:NUDIX domain-containing protein [Verrucomicrobiota bacterium]
MYHDESFGIIPLRQQAGEWQVFLVHSKRSSYWGIPKGHAEEEETPWQAAERELLEETGLRCFRLVRKEPFVEEYCYTSARGPVSKRVLYFAAEVVGEILLQQEEVDDGIWMALSAAGDCITYPQTKRLLVTLASFLSAPR